MKLINIKDVPKQILAAPLFTGRVERQSPVTDRDGSQISIDYVHFPKGVRNKLHKHGNDQVLIVIKGRGFVATKERRLEIKEGDIVWAPGGEEHWHGASPDRDFSHISITLAHTILEQIEK